MGFEFRSLQFWNFPFFCFLPLHLSLVCRPPTWIFLGFFFLFLLPCSVFPTTFFITPPRLAKSFVIDYFTTRLVASKWRRLFLFFFLPLPERFYIGATSSFSKSFPFPIYLLRVLVYPFNRLSFYRLFTKFFSSVSMFLCAFPILNFVLFDVTISY